MGSFVGMIEGFLDGSAVGVFDGFEVGSFVGLAHTQNVKSSQTDHTHSLNEIIYFPLRDTFFKNADEIPNCSGKCTFSLHKSLTNTCKFLHF